MAFFSLTRPTDCSSSGNAWSLSSGRTVLRDALQRWCAFRVTASGFASAGNQTHQYWERDVLDIDARHVCVIKEPEELAPRIVLDGPNLVRHWVPGTSQLLASHRAVGFRHLPSSIVPHGEGTHSHRVRWASHTTSGSCSLGTGRRRVAPQT